MKSAYDINEAAVKIAGEDGFNSGINWPDTWMSHGKPGGPFVTSAGYDEKSRAMNAQLSAERTAWLAGWEKGLAEKIATGRINPLLGTDNNARYHAQGN
jgi:hypothetical protein